MSIQFVEVDAERMIADSVAALEAQLGEKLLPGDARLILLMHFMEQIVGVRSLINKVAWENMLDGATGKILDAYAKRVGLERLEARPATTLLQFTLVAAQAVSVVVPQGTRATPDGTAYFATSKTLVIPIGEVTGAVEAESLLRDAQEGAKYNGYAVGAINALVDQVLHVVQVTNLDVSHSGVDREEDDAFRARIALAPTRYSTAGPKDAYIFHALSASGSVLDAEALRVAPGEVEVRLLLREEADDPARVVQTVLDHLNDRTIRPLTDRVTVQEAEAVAYDVDIVYAVTPIQETAVVRAVEGDGGALEQYRLWQDLAMGRDIDPDKLRALLFAAGAQRVTLTQPAFTAIAGHQRARRGAFRVTHEVMNR